MFGPYEGKLSPAEIEEMNGNEIVSAFKTIFTMAKKLDSSGMKDPYEFYTKAGKDLHAAHDKRMAKFFDPDRRKSIEAAYHQRIYILTTEVKEYSAARDLMVDLVGYAMSELGGREHQERLTTLMVGTGKLFDMDKNESRRALSVGVFGPEEGEELMERVSISEEMYKDEVLSYLDGKRDRPNRDEVRYTQAEAARDGRMEDICDCEVCVGRRAKYGKLVGDGTINTDKLPTLDSRKPTPIKEENLKDVSIGEDLPEILERIHEAAVRVQKERKSKG